MMAMQKVPLDAVQFQSMIIDFKSFLGSINLRQIWDDAMALNPHLPVIPTRSEWRGIEQGHNGSVDGLQSTLYNVAGNVTKEFSEQID